jgi:hypothetical protein
LFTTSIEAENEESMSKTILLAHHDPTFLTALVPRLSDLGHHVLSPARTARLALLIAAQSPATLAIIGETLEGRRNGYDLAKALRDVWGLPTIVVRDAAAFLELPAQPSQPA